VVFDISMSLDGYMRAANPTSDEPLGVDGECLHDWAFSGASDLDREVLAEGLRTTGAVVAGRRTYDDSLPFWGPDGPTGSARLPVIVVSHTVPSDAPEGGVYTFVDGIDAALAAAKRTAGDKDVTVMGGADIGQQYIRAGLVDELSLHIVPLLFGAGLRMFEHLGGEHRRLEIVSTVATPSAIHLRLRAASRSTTT
jgi:dihydrofolate reductase